MFSIFLESSNESIADAIKRLKKDPRSSFLFRSPTPTSIPDLDQFANAWDTFTHNNNIRAFAKSRPNISDPRYLSLKYKNYIDRYRDSAEQPELIQQCKSFIASITKETKQVATNKISSYTSKELHAWVNQNGGFYGLSNAAFHELDSLHLKPTQPVTLYRGLLFRLGSDNTANFLRSIRKGTGTVNLVWDRLSSWTTSKEIANRFATCRSASSNFDAMMGWMSKVKDQRTIDGDLGFVISTLARPEDILIDMRMVNVDSQHGHEGEVVLKPGRKIARIVKKYNIKGEVDPKADSVGRPDVFSKIDQFIEDLKIETFPLFAFGKYFNFTWRREGELSDLLSNLTDIRAKTIEMVNKINSIRPAIGNLTADIIDPSDPKQQTQLDAANNIIKYSKIGDGTPITDLKFVKSFGIPTSTYLQKSSVSIISDVADHLGTTVKGMDRAAQYSLVAQEKYLGPTINKVCSLAGIELSDYATNLVNAMRLLQKASKIADLHNSIDRLKRAIAEYKE